MKKTAILFLLITFFSCKKKTDDAPAPINQIIISADSAEAIKCGCSIKEYHEIKSMMDDQYNSMKDDMMYKPDLF